VQLIVEAWSEVNYLHECMITFYQKNVGLFRKILEVINMPEMATKIEGRKFMWDKGSYSSEGEAKEKMAQYEKDGFETRLIKEEDKFLIYTRRVVTEIVLEEGGQPL
jgi:hypothetical protein